MVVVAVAAVSVWREEFPAGTGSSWHFAAAVGNRKTEDFTRARITVQLPPAGEGIDAKVLGIYREKNFTATLSFKAVMTIDD